MIMRMMRRKNMILPLIIQMINPQRKMQKMDGSLIPIQNLLIGDRRVQ